MASYIMEIHKALARLGTNGTANPDAKSNTGKLLGETYLWSEVARYAEGKVKDAKVALETSGQLVINRDEPGTVMQCESQHFACITTVTKPIRRFDPDALASELKRRYKVPEAIAKQIIEAAKIGEKGNVTIKVTER